MAVILNIDLPNRCDECPLVTNGECPLIGIDVDEEMGSRDLNCPLKSVDKMMEEIQDYKIMVNKINYILSVINKYCVGEEPYGRNI